MTDTANAPERIWTADTTGNCSVGFNTPSLDYKNEYISRTHCDELVAAAYLDAARVPTSFLVGDPLNGIPFRSPMAHEVAGAIKDRTPDDARAALTAYGERMKAEGAREAQLRRLGPIAELLPDAVRAAEKAMVRYPQPNYVISKWAEETGEVTKDLIHVAEGRQTFEKLRGEIVQSLAMLHRLLVEGDQIHGLPPIAPALQENADE